MVESPAGRFIGRMRVFRRGLSATGDSADHEGDRGKRLLMIHRRNAGFTLIDMLITVTILAILAALVMPHFAAATDNAKIARVMQELQTVRGQLQLYRTQHGGRYPTIEQMWVNLTSKTDASGAVTANGPLGPYLKKEPANPFTTSTRVVAPGSETTHDGWTFDAVSGDLKAVGFDEVTKSYTAPGTAAPGNAGR
jgi:general secretion pathway protein G